jgi:hypothetical protein
VYIDDVLYEEEAKERIRYSEYKSKLNKTEFEYVQEFINIIRKMYSQLKFKVIFISFTQETQTLDNLLVIKTDLHKIHNFDELIEKFIQT